MQFIIKKTQEVIWSDGWRDVSNSGELYIYGKVCGIWSREGKYTTPKDCEAVLVENVCNREKFVQLLRYSVGDFYLVVKKDGMIYIYTSVGSSGLFYIQKNSSVHFYNDEREFYNKNREQSLCSTAVLDFTLKHPCKRNPMKTLLEKGEKLPGGSRLSVDDSLNTNFHYYLADSFEKIKMKDRERYVVFKDVLEFSVSQLYESYKKDRKVFLTISGGIDSVVIMLALKNTKKSFRALHWKKDVTLTKSVDYLCKKSNVEIYYFGEYITEFTENVHNLEQIKSLYKDGLGVIPVNNMLVRSFLYNKHRLLFGGGAFGVVVQGNAAMIPAFGYRTLRRWFMLFFSGKIPDRFLHTSIFRRIVKKGYSFWLVPVMRFFGSGLRQKDLPDCLGSYFKNIIFTKSSPVYPIGGSVPGCSGLSGKLDCFRQKTVFDIFLLDYLSMRCKKNINDLDENSLTVFAHACSNLSGVSSYVLNNKNYAKSGNYILQDPPMEGPLRSFFIDQKIGLRDVFFPKRYLFKYFKQSLGFSYFRFMSKTVSFYPRRTMGQYVRYVKKVFGLPVKYPLHNSQKNKIFLESDFFNKYLAPVLSPENSIVLSKISDPQVLAYLNDLYEKVQNGESVDFMKINQILNLEFFLRDQSL